MRSVIIGGGPDSAELVKRVAEGGMEFLGLEVLGYLSLNTGDPGLSQAKKSGWPILAGLEKALALDGLEQVIELLGDEDLLHRLYREVPRGVRVMDLGQARALTHLEAVFTASQKEIDWRATLERLLRQEREELQQILDSLPDAVLVTNRERGLERVNARFLELTGIRAKDLAKPCYQVSPFCSRLGSREDGEKGCAFDEVEKAGQPIQFIHFEPGLNGEERYFRIIQNPLFDDQGRVEKIIETARVITEQVHEYRRTEESERLFRQLVDNTHDMITIKDLEGRYLVINHPAAALLGMNPMDCLGRTDQEILPPRLAEALRTKDLETIQSEEHSSWEETLVIKGRRSYLHTVRFPLRDYKAEISGVCSISREVTEQKRLQEAVLQSEKLAAVGKLAASVAHELNNPLTGILTFAEELLEEAEPGDRFREDCGVIVREAMRCRRIVADLLDYARIKTPQHQETEVNQVVERALAMVVKQAAFHDVEFKLDLTEGLPLVRLDPAQMQQVFLNLIINAAEAMDGAGYLTIASRQDKKNGPVKVTVEDTGRGVPPDKHQAIFEPFYSTKGQQGNGLGLSVVRTIIEQHGGGIELESEPGRGSRFTVSLPLSSPKEVRDGHA